MRQKSGCLQTHVLVLTLSPDSPDSGPARFVCPRFSGVPPTGALLETSGTLFSATLIEDRKRKHDCNQ